MIFNNHHLLKEIIVPFLIICTVIACIQPTLFAWYYEFFVGNMRIDFFYDRGSYGAFYVCTALLCIVPAIVCGTMFLIGDPNFPHQMALDCILAIALSVVLSIPHFYRACIKEYRSEKGLKADRAVFVYTVVWLCVVLLFYSWLFLAS